MHFYSASPMFLMRQSSAIPQYF